MSKRTIIIFLRTALSVIATLAIFFRIYNSMGEFSEKFKVMKKDMNTNTNEPFTKMQKDRLVTEYILPQHEVLQEEHEKVKYFIYDKIIFTIGQGELDEKLAMTALEDSILIEKDLNSHYKSMFQKGYPVFENYEDSEKIKELVDKMLESTSKRIEASESLLKAIENKSYQEKTIIENTQEIMKESYEREKEAKEIFNYLSEKHKYESKSKKQTN